MQKLRVGVIVGKWVVSTLEPSITLIICVILRGFLTLIKSCRCRRPPI